MERPRRSQNRSPFQGLNAFTRDNVQVRTGRHAKVVDHQVTELLAKPDLGRSVTD